MSDQNKDTSARRTFLKTSAIGAAVVANYGAKLRPARAAGTDELRIGVIGCGGRGSGAAAQALKAAPNVKLVAIGDMFKDLAEARYKALKNQPEIADKIAVTPETIFYGVDAYKKVLATDCNYVILATPPGFRPAHLKAAVEAGKNIFTEKPMAVDGPGLRTCFQVAEEAKKKGISIGVGLQRRHQKAYLETMKRVRGGAAGDIVAGRVFWNQGALWMKPRQKEWTDLEWQLRNWLYFTWLSGDHIVEQHIHNIDVFQWAVGDKPPVAAIGVGGRQQRVDKAFGHVYDHFAIDFEYANDVHLTSMCRQIPNTHQDVSEYLVGTRGNVKINNKSGGAITGKKPWKYEPKADTDPYLQEHIDLIAALRAGKPYNELKLATESNLAAIMGRMAAYTGKRVTYEQVLNSQESLLPEKLEFGPAMAVSPVAIPGTVDII